MKKQNNSLWFTLVELIVVITILAILWTIAFISLQWYSAQARDTTRITDIQNIKTSLELFSLNTWKYPLPDDKQEVSYSWETLWYQWIVWDTVTTNLSRNLNEKPVDPLTETEYTYSTINSQTKYELLSSYESDLISYNNLLNETNAWNANYPKINWNYNWVFVKTTNYYLPIPSIVTSEDLSLELDFEIEPLKIKSQIITGWENNIANWTIDSSIWLLEFVLYTYAWTITDKSLDTDKQALAQVLINAYTWTILANAWIYAEIANTDLTDTWTLSLLVDNVVLSSATYASSWGDSWDQTPPAPTALVDYCESVWWEWVVSADDVNIWTNKWNWFCISPTVDLNNTNEVNDWFDWISWNWWWDNENAYYNWWTVDSVDDSWNNDSPYWQTRILNSPNWYTCTSIWSSTKWYTNSLDVDNVVWEDSLENRMRYLSKYKNDHDKIIHTTIDWIEFITTQPLNNHAIPALYLADCIDWTKDLWDTMSYTHITDTTVNTNTTNWNNTDNVILYSEYFADVTISTDSPADLDNVTYQNRQKYLTAWTQKTGSHLPSAFSYINNNTAWWELLNWSTTDWDKYSDTSTARWEYQVACEKADWSVWIIAWTEDNGTTWEWEWIWLSAVGGTTGTGRGRGARVVGGTGCGDQTNGSTGGRSSNLSARFVVRP